jgi:hypothetical protein
LKDFVKGLSVVELRFNVSHPFSWQPNQHGHPRSCQHVQAPNHSTPVAEPGTSKSGCLERTYRRSESKSTGFGNLRQSRRLNKKFLPCNVVMQQAIRASFRGAGLPKLYKYDLGSSPSLRRVEIHSQFSISHSVDLYNICYSRNGHQPGLYLSSSLVTSAKHQ